MFTPAAGIVPLGVQFFVMFTIHASVFTVKFPSRGTAPSEPHDLTGDKTGISPPPSSIRCLLMAPVSLTNTSPLIDPGIAEKSVNAPRTCFASASSAHEGI
ncbi:MAG: hypothetical protein C5S49_02305 [Candidatus Methanogaster sp.]|nr:MAG: hypothetical protein C5S49_02305 [ANME-2 cluster archaeon]